MARFRALASAGELGGAVAEFRGELLEGFALRDAPAFEDWQRGEADAPRRELATVLAQQVEAPPPRPRASLVELDPLHEPAHRALIRLYARAVTAPRRRQHRECVRTSRTARRAAAGRDDEALEAISEGTSRARPRRRRPGALAAGAARRPLVVREADRGALVALHPGSAPTGGSPCWRARPASARPGSPKS